jgi:hypothetical protein
LRTGSSPQLSPAPPAAAVVSPPPGDGGGEAEVAERSSSPQTSHALGSSLAAAAAAAAVSPPPLPNDEREQVAEGKENVRVADDGLQEAPVEVRCPQSPTAMKS